MAELELQIPARPRNPPDGAQPAKGHVQGRIDALPPFDIRARLKGLRDILEDINGARLQGAARSALIVLIDPEIDDVISRYQEHTHHHSFPLPGKDYALYVELQQLLSEAALAYKVLIIDLLEEHGHDIKSHLLRQAVLRCIDYLAQRALQAYAIYEDAPPEVWKDLHQLYAYSERKRIETDVVEHLSDLSISGAYARALLLAVANPFHLMHGEIYQTYNHLQKWALAVRFENPAELMAAPVEELVVDRYFCDLATDALPGYGMRELAQVPRDPRLLNLSELVKIIDRRIKTLALSTRPTLQLRLETDLLKRLRDAWEKRQLRSEARSPEKGTTVKAIIGLSACHYFFSGHTPFRPEQSEIALHGDAFHTNQTLSLLPVDETPWLDSDVKTKLETGVINPRSYRFDAEHIDNDIWKKAHSSKRREDTALERGVEERTQGNVVRFRLLNTSSGGELLESIADSPVHLRVGELIAAFPHRSDDGDEPILNRVRWIHCDAERKLRLGLRHLEGEVTPVAVRATLSDARFRSYARAFLLEDEKLSTASLITPAGLFECGETVLINHEDRIESVKLGKVLENTRAFTRFLFEPTPTDQQQNSDVIRSLKQLLYEE